jgi:hypothetical protein
MPACGRPYIPQEISTRTKPLWMRSRGWYCSMMDGGMEEIGMRMYSLRCIGVPR